MTNIICQNENYSTTRLLVKIIDDGLLNKNGKIENDLKFKINNLKLKIKNLKLIGKPEDKFETMLFLPEGEGRQGEGGLRTKGYFKFSYKNLMMNDECLILNDGNGNKFKYKNNSKFKIQNLKLHHLPLISIITVVYNGEEYLEETIKSVINQTYPNVEYIIIDGGSTDGTIDIIKKYEDYIDYWVSEPDDGIYYAMNKGWKVASNFASILFLGSGDRILNLPTKIRNNIIYYGDVYVGENKFLSTIRYGLRMGNTLHHQALLIPKQFSIEPPFDIHFDIYADFDFNQRLYKEGYIFQYCNNFIAYALPGGVSEKLDLFQMVSVSKKNCGCTTACLTFFYCFYQKIRYGI